MPRQAVAPSWARTTTCSGWIAVASLGMPLGEGLFPVVIGWALTACAWRSSWLALAVAVLVTLLPLLPAKQRETHPNDWMTTDIDIAGPDPNCGARYRITRLAKRKFRHSETTVVPLTRAED